MIYTVYVFVCDATDLMRSIIARHYVYSVQFSEGSTAQRCKTNTPLASHSPQVCTSWGKTCIVGRCNWITLCFGTGPPISSNPPNTTRPNPVSATNLKHQRTIGWTTEPKKQKKRPGVQLPTYPCLQGRWPADTLTLHLRSWCLDRWTASTVKPRSSLEPEDLQDNRTTHLTERKPFSTDRV